MLTRNKKVCVNVLMGILILGCLSETSVYGFAGGTGEPNNPYQIATAEDLISIGSDQDLLDKYYILIDDIDMDPNLPGGRVFTDALIAQDDSDGVGGHGGSAFDGTLDGQGHTIANLHIEGQQGYDAGLFGMLRGMVKDLRLTDVVVSGSPCGAIAGQFSSEGMVLRCSVTGQLSGTENVGGLIGSNNEGSLVECRVDVLVTGEDNVGAMVGGGWGGTLMRCEAQAQVSGQQNVGGLVGKSHQGQMIECRATAIVIGRDSVGGLIGDSDRTVILYSSANCDVTAEETAGGISGRAIWHSGPVLVNCYAQGSIAGSIVGGLVGEARHNQMINCYAACEIIPLEFEGRDPVVGGLFGDTRIPDWAPRTIACFWDLDLSGIAVSTGSNPLELGTGLNTEQMRNEDTFSSAGWDFSHTWTMDDTSPILQWEFQEKPE